MRFPKLAIIPFIVLGVLGGGGSSYASPVPQKLPNQVLTTGNYMSNMPDWDSPIEIVEQTNSERLLQAALDQLGVFQDCTDLVQNSLAALGYTTRRDQGGFDFGVQDVASTFAVQIPAHEARPGDIATTGPNNGGHVWIILDPATNEGVHGGINGSNTMIANNGVPISAHAVYRLV